jgi:hypothetical protein
MKHYLVTQTGGEILTKVISCTNLKMAGMGMCWHTYFKVGTSAITKVNYVYPIPWHMYVYEPEMLGGGKVGITVHPL